MPATIGAAALVPLRFTQPPDPNVSYTATFDATAATSATVRRTQAVSRWDVGLAMNPLQPLPAPPHAFSLKPRAEVSRASTVPPTPVTVGNDAGSCAPGAYPESPLLATSTTPGWS